MFNTFDSTPSGFTDEVGGAKATTYTEWLTGQQKSEVKHLEATHEWREEQARDRRRRDARDDDRDDAGKGGGESKKEKKGKKEKKEEGPSKYIDLYWRPLSYACCLKQLRKPFSVYD